MAFGIDYIAENCPDRLILSYRNTEQWFWCMAAFGISTLDAALPSNLVREPLIGCLNLLEMLSATPELFPRSQPLDGARSLCGNAKYQTNAVCEPA
jgi:hypothetical protein